MSKPGVLYLANYITFISPVDGSLQRINLPQNENLEQYFGQSKLESVQSVVGSTYVSEVTEVTRITFKAHADGETQNAIFNHAQIESDFGKSILQNIPYVDLQIYQLGKGVQSIATLRLTNATIGCGSFQLGSNAMLDVEIKFESHTYRNLLQELSAQNK